MDTLECGTRTARKRHRCGWCGNPIEKGEDYYHETNVDGGDIWRFKAHLKCESVFHALYQESRHRCPSCPLWEKTENHYGSCHSAHGWHDCVDRLYAALVKDGKIDDKDA